MIVKTTKKPANKTSAQQKRIEWDDSAAVNGFMRKLDHPLKPVLEVIRSIILGADRRITEGIKWNAPSFYFNGWFSTANVRGRDSILIVFHQGAKVRGTADLKIKDPAGLLEWLGKDRAIARFSNLADIKARTAALKAVVSQWVKQMPAPG
jgi:hypothetical protein